MKKTGSAMFTVMGMIFIISLVLGTMVKLSNQRAYSTNKIINKQKAERYADAGVSETYKQLLTNISARSAVFYAVDYHDGTYTPEIINISSNLLIIRAMGKCGNSRVTTASLFHYYDDPLLFYPEYRGWGKTILAKGSITIGGDTGGIKGSSHADKELILSGGLDMTDHVDLTSSDSITIKGSAESGGTLEAPVVKITGIDKAGVEIIERKVEPVIFPSLDLIKYYAAAETDDTIIDGKMFMTDMDFTGDRVVWIKGDCVFKKDIVYDGIIVATGDIKISGKSTFTGTDGGKIISRDGNITIFGGCDIKGLVYAPGDISVGGSVDIKGSILSGGSVTIGGTVGIIDYELSARDDISKLDDMAGILVHVAWVE